MFRTAITHLKSESLEATVDTPGIILERNGHATLHCRLIELYSNILINGALISLKSRSNLACATFGGPYISVEY